MMTFLNNYCRNDGSPVLVSVASIVSTVINIFLDWLFVFPLQKGLMGAAVATGISQDVYKRQVSMLKRFIAVK